MDDDVLIESIARLTIYQHLEQCHASDCRRRYCHERRHPQDEISL